MNTSSYESFNQLLKEFLKEVKDIQPSKKVAKAVNPWHYLLLEGIVKEVFRVNSKQAERVIKRLQEIVISSIALNAQAKPGKKRLAIEELITNFHLTDLRGKLKSRKRPNDSYLLEEGGVIQRRNS